MLINYESKEWYELPIETLNYIKEVTIGDLYAIEYVDGVVTKLFTKVQAKIPVDKIEVNIFI